MNQDEVYDLVSDLVRNLTCSELKLWLRTCKGGNDPRKLPKYNQYEQLFTEKGRGNWPAMHMVSLMAFDSLSEVRFFGDCAGGRN